MPGCQLTVRTGVREEKALQARMLGRSVEPAPDIRRPGVSGRRSSECGWGGRLWARVWEVRVSGPRGIRVQGEGAQGAAWPRALFKGSIAALTKATNLVLKLAHVYLLPYCFGGQKSPVGLPGLQSRCGQGCVPLGGSRGGWDRFRAFIPLISLLCPSLPT